MFQPIIRFILIAVAFHSATVNCKPLIHSLSIKGGEELAGLNAHSGNNHLAVWEANAKEDDQVGDIFTKCHDSNNKNGCSPKPTSSYDSICDHVVLEARSIEVGKDPQTTSTKNGKLDSASLKKSSTIYRNKALSGQTYTKDTADKVKLIPTPPTPPKDKDADHILEAQTVAKALNNGGYQLISDLPGTSYDEIKDVLNDANNLAFVDSSINRSKGQVVKATLSGNTPTVNPYVRDYVQKTAQSSRDTAKAIDDILKKYGVTGVSVQGEQNNVLRQLGIN